MSQSQAWPASILPTANDEARAFGHEFVGDEIMCDCISRIDADLKARGAALMVSIPLSASAVSKPVIPLMRTDTWAQEKRRGRPQHIAPTFCPFCGEKYPAPDAARRPDTSTAAQPAAGGAP